MSETPTQPIPRLARWLRESRDTTVFSGAGMSTKSGSTQVFPHGAPLRGRVEFPDDLPSANGARPTASQGHLRGGAK
jgi:hypothetical protein